jgi:hypothetical protein
MRKSSKRLYRSKNRTKGRNIKRKTSGIRTRSKGGGVRKTKRRRSFKQKNKKGGSLSENEDGDRHPDNLKNYFGFDDDTRLRLNIELHRIKGQFPIYDKSKKTTDGSGNKIYSPIEDSIYASHFPNTTFSPPNYICSPVKRKLFNKANKPNDNYYLCNGMYYVPIPNSLPPLGEQAPQINMTTARVIKNISGADPYAQGQRAQLDLV